MLPPPQSERCPILKTISQPEQLNSSLSQSVRFFNGSNPNQTRTTTKADPPPIPPCTPRGPCSPLTDCGL